MRSRQIKPPRRILSAMLTIVMTMALAVPAFAAEIPADSFSDVPTSHQFYTGVMYCAEKGIVNGYADGTFLPAKKVAKSHFCAMLARAFYADQAAQYDTDYYKKFGTFGPTNFTLAANGTLNNTSFQWSYNNSSIMGTDINRYDMAQLITNIMMAQGFTAAASQKDAIQSKITDYSSIPSEYQDAVKNVYALGIITGYGDGSFGGNNVMNRGQAAIVIQRMAQYAPAKDDGNSGRPGGQEAPDTGSAESAGADSGTGPASPDSTETTTPAPEPETETPAVRTLSNGKAITESNITEILNQLKITYPSTTSFGEGYYGLDSGRTPSSNCIAQIVSTYMGVGNVRCSTTWGCGGWAAFVADEIFGQRSSTWNWKKTTLTDIRPGDLMIKLDDSGLLMHVSICTGLVEGQSPTVRVYTTDAGSGGTGISANYKIGWNRCVTAGINYDVYTAYPD